MESVRLRSVAVDPEAKVPHRAAVLTGQRNAAVGSVNGYVVFQSNDGAPPRGAPGAPLRRSRPDDDAARCAP